VSAPTEAAIRAVLTSSTFPANGAATFTSGSGTSTRTYLALSDPTAGFQSSLDSVIDITGYNTGSLASLQII
jgi:serralysin